MRSMIADTGVEGAVAIAKRSTRSPYPETRWSWSRCILTRRSPRATSDGSAPRLTIAPTITLSESVLPPSDPGRDETETVSPTLRFALDAKASSIAIVRRRLASEGGADCNAGAVTWRRSEEARAKSSTPEN